MFMQSKQIAMKFISTQIPVGYVFLRNCDIMQSIERFEAGEAEAWHGAEQWVSHDATMNLP